MFLSDGRVLCLSISVVNCKGQYCKELNFLCCLVSDLCKVMKAFKFKVPTSCVQGYIVILLLDFGKDLILSALCFLA